MAVGRPPARRIANVQVLGVWFALAVLWLVLSLASPYFFTLANIRNILIAASTLSLVGAGLTVVLIAGEIDLSFAAMQAFAGAVAAVLDRRSSTSTGRSGCCWPSASRPGPRS